MQLREIERKRGRERGREIESCYLIVCNIVEADTPIFGAHEHVAATWGEMHAVDACSMLDHCTTV